MTRAIVLSRTVLGNGMCTVVGLLLNDGIRQIRLHNLQGHTLSYRDFSYKESVVKTKWVFGREIELGEIRSEHPRRTHPEDRRVNPREIRILEDVHTWTDLKPLLTNITFGSIKELFPLAPGERYVLDQALKRSVGYVKGVDLEIYTTGEGDFRADVRDAKGRSLTGVPIKGVELIEYLRRVFRNDGNKKYKTHDATVRFSLATPWNRGSGELKCYLQISDVHESPI